MSAARFVPLVVSGFLLAACGATAPVEEKAATTEAGFGRAFGAIRLVDNGAELAWESSLLVSQGLTLFVRPAGGGDMQYMDIPPGGAFFWPLTPGEYVIVGGQLVRAAGARTTRTLRLMTTFSVPRAGAAAYVGDLVVESRGGASRLQVLDRYDAALQRAAELITAAKVEPAKGLMRLEPLPGSVGRVTSICGGSWGIVCDENYQGVRPVRPERTEHTFALVATSAPQLEWQPSSRRGVAYDVIIYESLSFNYGLNGAVQGLRGARVAYAEGLREPKYGPQPLPHGKRYEWSVRLRDGDAVSTWSTTSYALFLVIAARRSSGQFFRFETPSP